jgi:hypothetical protein
MPVSQPWVEFLSRSRHDKRRCQKAGRMALAPIYARSGLRAGAQRYYDVRKGSGMTTRSRHTVWLLGLSLLHLAAVAVAKPEEDAPLPAGYTSDSSSEFVNGMFVHARYQNWGFSAASDRVMRVAETCRKEGRQSTGLEWPQIYGNEEYWLYRTDTEVVLFIRSYDARIDLEACRFEPVEVRTVTRLHVTSGALDWPSRFNGEELACRRTEICKRLRIAGMRARCHELSAPYVGSTDCVSLSRATRGMTLSTYAWSDDGQFADFRVTTVRVNARVNGAVFISPDRWKTDPDSSPR